MRSILSGNSMKKTQFKDAVRNIRKQIVSYLSIVVISMLAILTYLGISYSADNIVLNGSEFYERSNFRDAQIVSTYLITQEDVEAVRSIEGVSDVEGVYRTNAKIMDEEEVEDVMVVSLTERINTPQILSGRLPENSGECVLEERVSAHLGLGIGDTVELIESQGYIRNNSFVVTGIVWHPDHSCMENVSPGPRYVLVLPEVFDPEKFYNAYMTAEITFDGADDYMYLTDEYISYTDQYLQRLNELADQRAPERYEQVAGGYLDAIHEGEAQLSDAAEELAQARRELINGWDEYYDGYYRLQDARVELDNAEQQLEDARLQIEDGEAQLQDARAQLDDAHAQLEEGRAQLDATAARLEEGRAQLDVYQQQLDAGRAQLIEAQNLLNSGAGQLQAAQAQLDAGRAQLENGYAQLEDAKTSIRSALHEAIETALGTDAVNRIDWAPSSVVPDINDPDATATVLQLTNTVSVDLNQSMDDNIYAVIASMGIPEDELRSMFADATGIEIEASSESEVIEFIAGFILNTYSGIDSRYEEFAAAARSWDEWHSVYIQGLELYNDGSARYASALEQYNQGRAEYETRLAQFNDAQAQYDAAYAQYLEGEAQYAEGLARYEAGEAEYQTREAQLEQARAQYEAGLAQFEEGTAEYDKGVEDLAEGRRALEEGADQYDDGREQYNEGVEQVNSLKHDFELLDDCHWTVLGVEGNAGYMHLLDDSRGVSAMCATFASIFILVGALVIYATVGRIIDEQRRTVGATKALGLYNKEILAKYLSFGVTGTAIGSVLGIIAGYFIIQDIFKSLYGRNYSYGSDVPRVFDLPLTVIVFIGAIALSGLTVWIACNTLLKSSAIALMQDSAPRVRKAKKTTRKGKKKSLYGSLILLNMLSDKKRVIVTIVSIAGSCTLLVTGLTLNFSVDRSVDKQFDEVLVYDMWISFDSKLSETAEEDIMNVLDSYGASYVPVSDRYATYDMNGKISAFEVVGADVESLNSYIIRHDPSSDEIITDTGNGIWIYLRLAETMDVKRGDTITVFDQSLNPHHVTVAGVYTEFVGQEVIMSESVYASIFKNAEHNMFYVNCDESKISQIEEAVSQIGGFTDSENSEVRYNRIKGLASVLDYISALFVGIAGLMAYFILLNLVNMYVNQKKLELIIMRINGFTVKEVIRYVSLELIVSTLLGILLGLGFGSLLGFRIITLVETSALHFLKDIQLPAWGISALITALFSAVVSIWALRKVKYLKLTDVGNV